MSAELEQTGESTEEVTEEVTEAPKKVKKGFSLWESTISLLAEKAEETGMNHSAIVDSILEFGLPAFTENGMNFVKIVTLEEFEYLNADPLVATSEPTLSIPPPEPVIKKHGRRPKLRIPGQVGDGEQQQKEQGLYRPNIGQIGREPIAEPGTHTPIAGNERLATLEASMDFLRQQIENMQIIHQPQQTQQRSQQLMQNAPYSEVRSQQMPVQEQPPPVFAGSSLPGYTGAPPPGVVVPQPQAPTQPIYQQPVNQPQQRQDLQDPYAMNIGSVPGTLGQGGMTAQSLLSGANMTPNVGAGNINMDIARKALGPNWRNNLHQRQAANNREQ